MENARSRSRMSAANFVVDAIRTAVQKEEYKVGDKLPNEQELCSKLGVGRSSLREGMRILDAYGIVEIRQGEGTFVTNNYAERIFEVIGYMPENRNIQYMMELREIIEASSVRIVCEKLTDAECEELRKLISKVNFKNDLEDIVRADKAFHSRLVELTGNPLTIQIYKMLSKLQNLLMTQLMCHREVVEDAIDAHEEIWEALSRRDAAASADAVTRHIARVKEYIGVYIN